MSAKLWAVLIGAVPQVIPLMCRIVFVLLRNLEHVVAFKYACACGVIGDQ